MALALMGCSKQDETDGKADLQELGANAPPAEFVGHCIGAPLRGPSSLGDFSVSSFVKVLAAQPGSVLAWERGPGEGYILRKTVHDALTKRDFEYAYQFDLGPPNSEFKHCGPRLVVLSRVVANGAEVPTEQLYMAAFQIVAANAPQGQEALASPSGSAQPASAAASDGGAPAAAQVEPWDVPKLYPAAYSAWVRQVRAAGRTEDEWLLNLDGTGNANRLNFEGQDAVRVFVCEPHNCGFNYALSLVLPSSGRMVSLLHVETDGDVSETVVGQPTPSERACLERLNSSNDARTC